MSNFRQMLFTNWHVMRIARLAFGIFFGIVAYVQSDAIAALASAFFLYLAIANTSSCNIAGGSCSTVTKPPKPEDIRDVTYEEIK